MAFPAEETSGRDPGMFFEFAAEKRGRRKSAFVSRFLYAHAAERQDPAGQLHPFFLLIFAGGAMQILLKQTVQRADRNASGVGKRISSGTASGCGFQKMKGFAQCGRIVRRRTGKFQGIQQGEYQFIRIGSIFRCGAINSVKPGLRCFFIRMEDAFLLKKFAQNYFRDRRTRQKNAFFPACGIGLKRGPVFSPEQIKVSRRKNPGFRFAPEPEGALGDHFQRIRFYSLILTGAVSIPPAGGPDSPASEQPIGSPQERSR